MSAEGSVTRWIAGLRTGDDEAAQRIWERYYGRLVALARQKLQASPRRDADEEDVTQNAFHSFFQGIHRGRFPRVDDRDDLWRLLVVIAARKALDQLERERSRPKVAAPAARARPDGEATGAAALTELIGDEPTPDFAAQVAEEYRLLLERLGDDSLRKVAVWKMEGHSNPEIADKLASSLRTVARKLEAIRAIWQAEARE
jgi:DNA-directed RNA polymerase specialized sigma24 family protein